MSLFRKDPFGPAWVLISPERGLEASDFGSAFPLEATSPLSPGSQEPPASETLARRPASAPEAGGWRMRVISHPSALLQPKAFALRRHGRAAERNPATGSAAGPLPEVAPAAEAPAGSLFTCAPSSGYQEIIVEHPDARLQLDTMPLPHLTEVLKLYRERLGFLAAKPDVRHVQITRNVGAAAGALFQHPHAQLLAMPVPNRWVEEEVEAAAAHHRAHGRCLFCDVLDAELASRERIVSHNGSFVALAPYASKTPFEWWLLPRRHTSAFGAAASNTMAELAQLLRVVVRAMNAALDHPPYNLILHTLPHENNAHYHWHLEVLPRLTRQAGFDWGNGFYVNPTPPEDAARFLREALALQEVAE